MTMQLPRGKFRSIKKGVPLGEILNEMATSGFSGICSFSSNTVNGTIVFKGGEIILAKVQAKYGDPAIEEARSMGDQVIDAVLSDLDGTQMQLALDFNKQAHVLKGGIWQGGSPQKETSRPVQGDLKKPAPDHRTVPKEKDFTTTPAIAHADTPVPGDASTQIRQEQPPSQGPQLTSAEKEFETFDSMDLEDVTRKIRRDSKIILKQLELDHLMEK